MFTLPFRIWMIVIALVLGYAMGAALERSAAVSWPMFFLVVFPGMPLASRIVATFLQPRYERRSSPFTTLLSK